MAWRNHRGIINSSLSLWIFNGNIISILLFSLPVYQLSLSFFLCFLCALEDQNKDKIPYYFSHWFLGSEDPSKSRFIKNPNQNKTKKKKHLTSTFSYHNSPKCTPEAERNPAHQPTTARPPNRLSSTKTTIFKDCKMQPTSLEFFPWKWPTHRTVDILQAAALWLTS